MNYIQLYSTILNYIVRSINHVCSNSFMILRQQTSIRICP